METLGTVAELWRYPVKSIRGERLNSGHVDDFGLSGDRRFAIESSGAPTGKPLLTGRERTQMLLYTACGSGDEVVITTPDGQHLPLSDPATLPSIERALGTGNALRLLRSDRPLTDCRPVSVLSLQTIRQLEAEFGGPIDLRRFRANLLLDLGSFESRTERIRQEENAFSPDRPLPFGTAPNRLDIRKPRLSERSAMPEEALVGRRIRIGSTAVLTVTERDPRCRIVTLDPETAQGDPGLMRLIDRLHGGCIGVYASVHTPGPLRTGDPVRLL